MNTGERRKTSTRRLLSERPEQWYQKNKYRRSLVGESMQPFRIGWETQNSYTPDTIWKFCAKKK